MKFQIKKNRVQCYRVDDSGKTMITSIKLGTARKDIDLKDERNSRLTDEELSAYQLWFNRHEERELNKRRSFLDDFEKSCAQRLEINMRELMSQKRDLSDEQKDLLISSSVDILKLLKPELLEPKITFKMFLKSLFS